MAANASESNEPQVIIIRKKKKGGGGHGHHGGAWKVAYADFVTAMMAFFLLLWLLNVTTDEQRKGIADYFDPANIARATSGSGGVLGGTSVSSPGQMSSPSSPLTLYTSMPGRSEPVEDSDTLDDGSSEEFTDAEVDTAQRMNFEEFRQLAEDLEEENGRPPTQAELEEALAAQEEAQFEEAAEQLRQAIQSVPELADLAENLIVEQTPEGLRIQIVDQEQYSMFPIGSAEMYGKTTQLLSLVAQVVRKLPNDISISGHTDGTPYVKDATYGNWELSTDRANASRRALIRSGLGADRIATVVGRADTDHLFPDEPESPRNRRISIVLLRDTLVPTTTADAGAGAAGPANAAQNDSAPTLLRETTATSPP